MSTTIEIGKKLPKQSFLATPNTYENFGDLEGKKLILYFYPKDNTSGCSAQAEAFRDYYPTFQQANIEIMGVSRDSIKSHQQFIKKFHLPFCLISDEDSSLCHLFNVLKEKSLYGRKYLGIERSTFLFDEKRKLKQEWRNVKVKGHIEVLLKLI